MFKDSAMHFNHLVRPESLDVVKDRRCLLPSIARSAGIVRGDKYRCWDVLLPYLFSSDVLHAWNVGFILIKVTNDATTKASQAAGKDLLKLMDPFAFGLMQQGRDSSVPIVQITISLAQGVKGGGLHQVKYDSECSKPELEADSRPVQFTTYDYYCEGYGLNVFKPFENDWEVGQWRQIILGNLTRRQDMFGNSKGAENAIRAMDPLVERGHDANFVDWEMLEASSYYRAGAQAE
ncbi:hypothetical protein AX16_003115 [Volvariella volvacea WC 439]|nr:hypothetical protein AX16_003115 [Volvariella volvacea WC 439]